MLSSHSMIEFRMCNVGAKGKGAHENGPEFAQKLANLLGCRVKVYLEPVNPYGWSDIKGGKGNFGRSILLCFAFCDALNDRFDFIIVRDFRFLSDEQSARNIIG